MKLRATFKTPDVVGDELIRVLDLEPEETRDGVRAALIKVLSRFVRYGELVTIEFDSIAQTATVLAYTPSTQ